MVSYLNQLTEGEGSPWTKHPRLTLAPPPPETWSVWHFTSGGSDTKIFFKNKLKSYFTVIIPHSLHLLRVPFISLDHHNFSITAIKRDCIVFLRNGNIMEKLFREIKLFGCCHKNILPFTIGTMFCNLQSTCSVMVACWGWPTPLTAEQM